MQLGMLVIISAVNDKVDDVMMLGVTGETIFTLARIRRQPRTMYNVYCTLYIVHIVYELYLTHVKFNTNVSDVILQ